MVRQKPLNASVIIPNMFRNNSVEYKFEMSLDTDLVAGDYMVFMFTGIWNIFTNATQMIAGVGSSATNSPVWTATVDTVNSRTELRLTNFSRI